jgi:hypothetical protein
MARRCGLSGRGKACGGGCPQPPFPEAARNNQSLAADPEDDWETLYSYGGPQSYRALSQYQVTTAPGSYYAPINNGGSFKRISAAAFEAVIPEPTSLALLGIGGLWVARRRR